MDAEALASFQRAQAEVTDRVDAVEADQWDTVVRPGRTVVDLVAHLTAEQLRVPPLLGGVTDAGGVPTDTDELVAGDPLGSWEAAADGALTAWAQPAAGEGTVLLPSGPVPATEYLAELTALLAVGAWDLARATGGDTRLDDVLVSAVLRFAGSRADTGGLPGAIGPALGTPAGADPQTRMLARFGRRA